MPPDDTRLARVSQPAYGGAGWVPRQAIHRAELGRLWGRCGIDSEWRPLQRVMLCRPGAELAVEDAEAALFSAPLDLARAGAEHDALADLYRAEGVEVLEVGPAHGTFPNRMFAADLFAMTPEGAIVARPAGEVRAGEEVAMAAALAGAGVPILRTLTHDATFEGADLLWIDGQTAAIGKGMRTNAAGVMLVTQVLSMSGITVHPFDMPVGTMHLMGMLRILDRDLALAWPRRTPHGLVELLRGRGYRVELLDEALETEALERRSFNLVTLGPRRVVMPGPAPMMRAFLEGLGVAVLETGMAELGRANGAAGCLTGIVAREMAGGV